MSNISPELFTCYGARYLSGQRTNVNSRELILVDYMPVCKYIENVAHYAYLDFIGGGKGKLRVIYKRNARTSDQSQGVAAEYFEDFIKRLSVPRIIRNWLKTFNIEFKDPEKSYENNLSHLGLIEEVNGVLLLSDEFSAVQKLISEGTLAGGTINLFGFELDKELKFSDGSIVSLQDWLTRAYNNYMLSANLALGDYYTRFVQIGIDQRKKPFVLFNQFVPMIYKFNNVFNPITDTQILAYCKKTYPILNKCLEYSDFYNTVIQTKLQSMDPSESNEVSRGIFRMTRRFYQSATGTTCEVDNKHDYFSFAFHNALLYDVILRRGGMNWFMDLQCAWYMYYDEAESGLINVIRFSKALTEAPNSKVFRLDTGYKKCAVEYFLTIIKSSTIADIRAFILNKGPLSFDDINKIDDD